MIVLRRERHTLPSSKKEFTFPSAAPQTDPGSPREAICVKTRMWSKGESLRRRQAAWASPSRSRPSPGHAGQVRAAPKSAHKFRGASAEQHGPPGLSHGVGSPGRSARWSRDPFLSRGKTASPPSRTSPESHSPHLAPAWPRKG